MAIDRKAGLKAAGMLLVAVVLSACGNGERTPSSARPVLVARAGAVSGHGQDNLTAYAGEIRAREETALSFRVGGKLVRRLVDVGDRVRSGDVLAEIDPGDLRLQVEALQAQSSAAEAQLARVRADHARIASLAKDQLVSRSALDQQTAALRAAEGDARAARAQLDLARNQAGYSQLRAPRDGAIASRQAEAGQVVAAGQAVFGLAADGGREVAFALPESNIRDFQVGQPVLIELWSAAGVRIPGRIREIAPAADPQARTYAARATLDGAEGQRIDLGQSARVYIPAGGEVGAMRLPLSALHRGDGDKTIVWVVDPKAGKVRRVAVKTGPYAADGAAVLSGLKPADWVVMAGGHLLHEGQDVIPVDRSNRPIASN
ncbi:efflux RND transporter periplasmic adaptor subunit [Lysobacter hankyongensis]|uniref:Multidrug efflux RND transporter periplasmic adaptor subunit MexJ n=1 Tax=Lysobacter hankyongensis TaxID=1176535 RepID=A0ABP9C110_9GAMM